MTDEPTKPSRPGTRGALSHLAHLDHPVEVHQVTADELQQLRARLDEFEARYGMPSHRMLETPEFSDEDNMLEETDDLMEWSSLWDRYEALTSPELQQSLPESADEQPAPRKPPLRSSFGKLAHLADSVGEWDIAAVRADLTAAADRSLDEHHPDDEPDNCAIASLYELAGAKLTGEERQATLNHGLRAVRALVRQRDEARAWAWSLEHKMLDYVAMELDPDGDGPMEPSWLTSPAAPYERVYDALLADFTAEARAPSTAHRWRG